MLPLFHDISLLPFLHFCKNYLLSFSKCEKYLVNFFLFIFNSKNSSTLFFKILNTSCLYMFKCIPKHIIPPSYLPIPIHVNGNVLHKIEDRIFIRTFVSFNKHRTTCNQIKFNISLLNISFGATAEGVLIALYVCLFLLLNTTSKSRKYSTLCFLYVHIFILLLFPKQSYLILSGNT